ncbi:efflux RND transporter permease subunit [Puteibacter caeruleilacunae]|nr:efflux RND transporter permease subunit [Puteibacter caeruleilacunae]
MRKLLAFKKGGDMENGIRNTEQGNGKRETGTRKRKFSSFSIIISFVALMIMGVSFIPMLNVQFEPSRTLPSLSVRYSWYNASARVIEQEVTTKLEGLFSVVNGVQEVNSTSSKGSGSINIRFKKYVNLDAVRFEIATLIRQVYPDLPEQVSFPSISMSTSGSTTRPVLGYTLNASASPFYIQKFAENNIAPALSVLKGVNEVRVYGSTPYEWEIVFDVATTRNLGIQANEIANAINGHFRKEIVGAGNIKLADGENRMITVQLQNAGDAKLDWSKIPVAKVGDRIVPLEDIAKVRYKEQLPQSYYRINGLNTINIQIIPTAEANNIKLSKLVREKVAQMQEEFPPGYSMMLAFDSTEYIAGELQKIGLRTLFSMLILLLFVLVISRQWRYLLLITVSLFANLIIACIFYYILKLEIHLYSLAGITISFGIIVDNSIVMIDHMRHQKNRKVFIAILAATLTTIGSLCIIFFLDENQRVNLVDFAWVIIVNLSVSMLIALFFIPALMEKLPLRESRNRVFFRRKKRVVRMTRGYVAVLRFGKRFRWAFIVLFILGFGVPVHWLPDKVEKKNFLGDAYNNTIGSSFYQEDVRPWAEKILGGSLRLFSEHVFESSFYSDPQKTTLYVRCAMPEGCTVQQLNEVIMKMENYISRFDEVELFQTSINGYRNSNITINFKEEFANGGFPFFLKEELTSKAISLGGTDHWSIYGVGKGFNNSLYSGYKNSRIILEGYNYEKLYRYAEDLKKELLKNGRIQEVDIAGSAGWNVKTLYEFYLDFDHEQLGLNKVKINNFYNFLKNQSYKQNLTPVFLDGEAQPVSLVSSTFGGFNVWELKNNPVEIGEMSFKLDNLGSIEKMRTGNDIYKYNQQYQLVVMYDFIGPGPLSNIVRERHIKRLNSFLPLGFKAKERKWSWWNKKDKKQYYLLLLIIVIIYFICSILLESLLQPLTIIAMIPMSFIGVFLTFYLFDFNFDQGGFASFILLSGLVVNAGLYIINDYNQFCRVRGIERSLPLYIKAFNHKIIPIFLTIISTILGLVPFVWSGQKEVFWFAFAAGAMGGLLFSFVAILLYLPLFLRTGKHTSGA